MSTLIANSTHLLPLDVNKQSLNYLLCYKLSYIFPILHTQTKYNYTLMALPRSLGMCKVVIYLCMTQLSTQTGIMQICIQENKGFNASVNDTLKKSKQNCFMHKTHQNNLLKLELRRQTL